MENEFTESQLLSLKNNIKDFYYKNKLLFFSIILFIIIIIPDFAIIYEYEDMT